MKKLALIFIILLISNIVFADTPSELPSFGEAILKEQFPKYKESDRNIVPGLRRYRGQLEDFRVGDLEGFNRAVLAYRKKLVKSDKQLEAERKKGKKTKDKYLKQHEYIKSELKKSNARGEYMYAYYKYLRKYLSESKWVIQEIAVEEKKKFKF